MYRYSIFRRKRRNSSGDAVRIDQHLDRRSSAILIRHIELNTDQANVPFTVDKKLFDKFNKLIEKLSKLCDSQRIQSTVLFVKSWPYLPLILIEISNFLANISKAYELTMYVLNGIEYFNVTSQNLLAKLKNLDKLLQSVDVFNEKSEEQADFKNLGLILSYILADLKAMFPFYVYEGLQFQVESKQAADFWRLNFQERTIVPWSIFEQMLNRVSQIGNPLQAAQLRDTIQLTQSKHVSIFEFNIFTRLFQPWNFIITIWRVLVLKHPAYVSNASIHKTHQRLRQLSNKPGSYLYRPSFTKLGHWVIGYVDNNNQMLHFFSQNIVNDLIQGFDQGRLLYPNGNSNNFEINYVTRLPTTKEQHEIYLDLDSSFQTCKICTAENKNRRLEPCGHLICSNCLSKWNKLSKTCPFCRCEIKRFKPVIISSYEQPHKSQVRIYFNIT